MSRWAWWWRQGWRQERGALAVVLGLGITAFIGFAAISIDVGRLFVERFQLRNAADAAALGGAQLLPDDPAGARATALAILAANGVAPGQVEVSVEGESDLLRVRAGGAVDLTFARVLGMAAGAVEVESVARVGAVTGLSGATPLGIEAAEFVPGETYLIKLCPGGSTPPEQGNFHALALGGRGARVYRENLSYGYDDVLAVGDTVLTETGNMSGPTEDGIAERIAADPDATYETFSNDSPRLLLVPLVDDFDVSGRSEVGIVGFAAFFLEDVSTGEDGNAQVVGRFVDVVRDGEDIGDIGEAPPCSLRGVDLVQ
jgi:hypothetical protein